MLQSTKKSLKNWFSRVNSPSVLLFCQGVVLRKAERRIEGRQLQDKTRYALRMTSPPIWGTF